MPARGASERKTPSRRFHTLATAARSFESGIELQLRTPSSELRTLNGRKHTMKALRNGACVSVFRQHRGEPLSITLKNSLRWSKESIRFILHQMTDTTLQPIPECHGPAADMLIVRSPSSRWRTIPWRSWITLRSRKLELRNQTNE
jgi:hypothetical protein